MDNIIIAIGGANCGTSPVMPYIGTRFDGKDFTRIVKLYLETALLRCDFDALDIAQSVDDIGDMAMQVNRHTADGAVLISLEAFGSRKSFNDFGGSVVKYCSRRGGRSKIFCEDICSFLSLAVKSDTEDGGAAWQAVGCPTATVDVGYITNFDDLKRALDPDFQVNAAEHIAMGICEHFGMPYVKRDDILSYPLLCSSATGKRGKKIKMLQALLGANGYMTEIDGIYGKHTDDAVKQAAINNGMSETDGVNAALWRDLLLLNKQHVEFGSKCTTALYIQRKLFAKLYKTPMDGCLGEQTLCALNEYLKDIESGITVSRSSGVSSDVIKLLSPVGGGRPRLF